MAEIILTQGKSTIVDDEDYDFLMRWEWRYRKDGYAWRTIYLGGKKQIAYMHRVIMNTPKGMDTDHVSGNTLDNRKENLRICTVSQNHMNQRKTRGSSKYKGVSWYKRTNKWQAYITINRIVNYLGFFTSEKDAALAYNNAATKYYGEFARLNPLENSCG